MPIPTSPRFNPNHPLRTPRLSPHFSPEHPRILILTNPSAHLSIPTTLPAHSSSLPFDPDHCIPPASHPSLTLPLPASPTSLPLQTGQPHLKPALNPP